MKTINIFLLVLLLTTISFSQKEMKKVTFALHWIPQSQFAGYYVAFDKGIYKKYGIDVEIIPANPRVPSSILLEKAKVDLASMWLTNALQLIDRGVKIVNLAQVINRSALMLVAKKSSGINSPQDMEGKKIGIWGGDYQIQPDAFFKKYKLDVRVIPQGNSVNLFLQDGIDVTSAMWYNEYHTILNSGLDDEELNEFFFADYGLNFPEEGIYCSTELLERDPELCRDFILASFEGWKLAFQNPEEALNIMIQNLKKLRYPANRSHEKWMLGRMKDLIMPDNNMTTFGELSESDFEFVCKTLKDYGTLKLCPSFQSFYKPVRREKK